jgi:hypothetical protein
MKTRFKQHWTGKMIKINTQQELVEWLKNNPCKTELEICQQCFDSKTRDKKHADLIRRALDTNKIDRVRVKFHDVDNRKLYRYFVK